MFLMRSLPELVRHFEGVGRLLTEIVGRLRDSGVRSTGGWLISLAAYTRRLDPSLYRTWISQHEVDTNPFCEFCIVLTVGSGPLDLNWLQEFRSRIPTTGLILIGSEDIDTVGELPVFSDLAAFQSELKDSCYPSSVILLSTPAEINFTYGKEIVAELGGASMVVWDHDYLVNSVRTDPVFKGRVTQESFIDPDFIPAWATTKTQLLKVRNVGPLSAYSLALSIFQDASRSASISHVVTHHLQRYSGNDETAEAFRETFGYKDEPTRRKSRLPDAYHSLPGEFLVSIIIPTRNRLDLVTDCLESIRRHQYEQQIEIVLVNNDSDDEQFLEWYEGAMARGEIVGVDAPGPFNWSRINNLAFRKASGQVLVFLNNDVTIQEADWVFKLASVAMDDSVGAVGPLLLYPNGKIQHAGVVTGFGGAADHIYSGNSLPAETEHTIFCHPLHRRQVAAVTGACLAIQWLKFERMGGFNEELSVAGDLELCLRLDGEGLRNIYLPSVQMIHLESDSRHKGLPQSDFELLKQLLPEYDPYFSKNLSLKSLTPIPRGTV